MANLLKALLLTLYETFKVKEFILSEVGQWYEYVDGKLTDKMLGHKYTVVVPKTYDKLIVKVADTAPIITQDEIGNSSQPIMVNFTGDEVRFYRANNGEWLPTIKAVKASIVNKAAKTV